LDSACGSLDYAICIDITCLDLSSADSVISGCVMQQTPILYLHIQLLCPDEAIRTPTATTNIDNMPTSNMYVLLDDLLYSPNRSIPQKVLTSGSA